MRQGAIVMVMPSVDVDLLGAATPSGEQLVQMVSAAVRRPVDIEGWSTERVPYEAGSPATGALLRLRGVTTDGAPWSLFLKVLQHPRHWVHLDRMPPPIRADFVANFPWRSELAAWDPEFLRAMPDGLRVPELYRLEELPGNRVAIWMEDVDVVDEPWSLDRFRLAAGLLGGLAAKRSAPEQLAACPVPVGFGLRRYADGPVTGARYALDDDSRWEHPALRTTEGRQLRSDLRGLARRIPAILDMLDRCPQSLPHGDASPQNLLVPRNEPDTLVAIDIAFQCPLAIGFDLAQLLVGLAHAGQLAAADLPAVHRVLQPAFADGFAHGGSIDPAVLSRGYLGSLIVRNAFTSIPYGELDSLPTVVIQERLALTRFLCDLAREIPD